MSAQPLHVAHTDHRFPAHLPGLILSQRLRLEPVRPVCLDALYALVEQTDVRRHLFADHALTREEMGRLVVRATHLFETSGRGMWGMRRHGHDDVIGFVCLWPFDSVQGDGPQDELAFALSDTHQGRGFAHEACQALIGYARKQLGWTRLGASADLHNTAANRVLWRLGFAESLVVRGRSGPLRLFKRAL